MKIICADTIKLTPKELLVLQSFLSFVTTELGIKGDPQIHLLPRNFDANITTGAYDRTNNIYSRFEGRALIDTMRTIAHELVHMMQMERGDFDQTKEVQDVGGAIEDEANAVAGKLLKMFKNQYNCHWVYSL